MLSGGVALRPTFQGHVPATQDALILFEACLQGHLSHVSRRPHDRERSSLIRSGSVFVYEENASNIKRWTDGVIWSPSRILGNFLVYRELDKPFPPGEKKRAMKKENRTPSRPGDPYHGPLSSENRSFSGGSGGGERAPSEVERQSIGSLIDSYDFKHDGLVKKTISVTVQGVTHHLVSYYSVHDIIANSLWTPSQTENLQYIRPRLELISKQNFRVPIVGLEDVDGPRDVPNPYRYGMGTHGYVQNYRAPYSVAQHYPPMNQLPGRRYPAGFSPVWTSYLQRPDATPQISGRHVNQHAPYDQARHSRGYEASTTSTLPTMSPTVGDRAQSTTYPPPSNLGRLVNYRSPACTDPQASMSSRPTYSESDQPWRLDTVNCRQHRDYPLGLPSQGSEFHARASMHGRT